MASNKLPPLLDDLTSFAEECADGAHHLNGTINLKQNTEAAIRADLNAFLAARGAFAALAGATSQFEDAVEAARLNARRGLLSSRDRLKLILGARASTQWTAVGFPAHSYRVPTKCVLLLPMLDSFKAYFTQHAAHEVAELGATVADMHVLHEALSDAHSARNSHRTEKAAAMRARKEAEKALRRRLRGLIGELNQLLGPLNANWMSFGLKQPGQRTLRQSKVTTQIS